MADEMAEETIRMMDKQRLGGRPMCCNLGSLPQLHQNCSHLLPGGLPEELMTLVLVLVLVLVTVVEETTTIECLPAAMAPTVLVGLKAAGATRWVQTAATVGGSQMAEVKTRKKKRLRNGCHSSTLVHKFTFGASC